MDLRWLFLDMNSFFASCEQQEHPELRGRPVAVAPVDSDSTCCIAASYEAKALGIKCGTNVGLARRLCPELVVVNVRHGRYIQYHEAIIDVVRRALPDPRVLSVDEVACRLWSGNEHAAGEAVALARHLKRQIRAEVGEQMLCSVGLAPNAFLAKVATELHKPDGLVALRGDDLPGALSSLALSDLPGIGRRMNARLLRCGIQTIEELYAADRWLLRIAWGGVVGERWWFMLRGDQECDYPGLETAPTKSVGHSHVLAPEVRNDIGAEGVLLRLTAKAVSRLRRKGFVARSVGISLRHRGEQSLDHAKWSASSDRRAPCADPLTLIAAVRSLWAQRPRLAGRIPTQVGVVLSDLVPRAAATLSLFDDDRRNEEVAVAMDQVRERFGADSVDLASVFFQKHGRREAIAFAKITDDDRERRARAAEIGDGIERSIEDLDVDDFADERFGDLPGSGSAIALAAARSLRASGA